MLGQTVIILCQDVTETFPVELMPTASELKVLILVYVTQDIKMSVAFAKQSIPARMVPMAAIVMQIAST